MSTADSQLLVAASSFASDLYKPIIRKQASNKEMLWVSRIVVLVIAVVAYFIASSKGQAAQAIMDLVSNAWGIFGAAFGPVVLLSLFWKRFTYKGAVAGIIVGAAVDMLWLWLPIGGATLTASTGIYEIIPGFIIGGIAAIVVTLIDKAPSKEVEAIFATATDNSIDDYFIQKKCKAVCFFAGSLVFYGTYDTMKKSDPMKKRSFYDVRIPNQN